MITKVYACDKCRQPKQIEELATFKSTLELPANFSANIRNRTIRSEERHICKDCLIEKKLFVECDEKKYEELEKEVKVSLEDLFTDYLTDLGVVFNE